MKKIYSQPQVICVDYKLNVDVMLLSSSTGIETAPERSNGPTFI